MAYSSIGIAVISNEDMEWKSLSETIFCRNMHFISEREVRENLQYGELVSELEKAFLKVAKNEVSFYPRIRASNGGITMNMLPSIFPDHGVAGLKVYLNNGKSTNFQYLLFDTSRPSPIALMEANYLGQIRTGALSALATKLLFHSGKMKLLIVGSGFQAESQLLAHHGIFEPEEISVFSRNRDHAYTFSRKMAGITGKEIKVEEDLGKAIENSNVICSATSAKEPIFKAGMFPDQFHLNLVGSNILSRSEAESTVFKSADDVFVEDLDQAKLESAEIINILKESPGFRINEFKELVENPGKYSSSRKTVFKSMGNGIEDLVAASIVCRNLGITSG